MITEDQQQRLEDLKNVFLEENTKLNLSALRDEDSVWIGNILDSVVALDLEIFHKKDITILDVGTGGGFPLLPLAICLPDTQCTGLDSTQKKLDAITRMKDALGIENVRMLSGRCEEKGRKQQHRNHYDIVTARAVAPLNVLLEYCSPFVKPGGYFVAWKSMKVDTELEESLLARAELSCHLEKSYEYELPKDWGKRQLLIFKKTSPTSEKYPRSTGTPKLQPIT
ncbi:16S rRNA (guanine(527)-N(7))-methyltransferase RsmG [Candidatus Peregrinibacteria bacterium CG10_big_fil_rev_8_21_14_0_10_42_8]|nr:MAG: 16S rRNA (guanine(527)-N(7))-methyltransferase RsmG [Candidatus Peregrinibacteria bacterium CG10_big_fil_rev_8_21_14_0_10_42_8]